MPSKNTSIFQRSLTNAIYLISQTFFASSTDGRRPDASIEVQGASPVLPSQQDQHDTLQTSQAVLVDGDIAGLKATLSTYMFSFGSFFEVLIIAGYMCDAGRIVVLDDKLCLQLVLDHNSSASSKLSTASVIVVFQGVNSIARSSRARFVSMRVATG